MRLQSTPRRSDRGSAVTVLDRPRPAYSGPILFDVCVLGLGYVGLPTALSLTTLGRRVLGVDISERRLAAIRSGDVDVLDEDRARLGEARRTGFLELTDDPARLAEANAVLICVPTPIDHHRIPDLALLQGACELVVANARAGQTVILTSTSYVGTTSDLLIEPLRRRGFTAGRDIYIAFSPERIDPGNATHPQHAVPRIVGGADSESTHRAVAVLKEIAPVVHVVSDAATAEMTKLYENTFRAVNIAFALEMSQAATALGLSVIEVIDAAATKPYGFMAFYPGPGVGGHCIPCDPHYLLWQLREQRLELPTVDRAMATIAARPRAVAHRLRDLLAEQGKPMLGARVLLVGASYKPGVQDTRESSAIQLARDLVALGAQVALWDPLARTLDLEDGRVLTTVDNPQALELDAVVVHTVHPGLDHQWLERVPVVLDASYRLDALTGRAVV
jgi:UDP-N-acetyl-D-glucosamine dehydrogenase